jgi:TctA family transporter
MLVLLAIAAVQAAVDTPGNQVVLERQTKVMMAVLVSFLLVHLMLVVAAVELVQLELQLLVLSLVLVAMVFLHQLRAAQ